MSKNVLYVVEGFAERDLLNRLWNRFEIGKEYHVQIYNTNIHVLMNEIFINDEIDPDIDLLRILRNRNNDPETEKILDKKYTDIYLIFDLEPHDQKFNAERIKKMMSHYKDSTNEGKLFINYPMIESYRHITSENDVNFKDRIVPIASIGTYKKIVNEEAWNKLKQLGSYDATLFRKIIGLHLMKSHYLTTGLFQLPTVEEYLSDNSSMILDIQLYMIENLKSLYVLNTCIFNVIDYAPSRLLNQITKDCISEKLQTCIDNRPYIIQNSEVMWNTNPEYIQTTKYSVTNTETGENMSNPVNVIRKDQKISNKITSEYPPVPEGKNVLYLVGGESDFNLMCTLWDSFETEEFNVFVYGTDLRRIVEETFPDGKYNPNVDLLEQLRKTEFLPHKRYHIEQKKYDYIYMIFNYDPSIEQDKLMMVMDHFDDAKDKGKLYLNYPTADSFRHVIAADDQEFMDRTSGAIGSRYKNEVDRSCLPKLRVVDRCGTEILKELIQMHLKKANYILNGDYELPKKEDLKKLKGTEILEAQNLAKELYDEVYVLNTSVFNIVEEYPEKFLD